MSKESKLIRAIAVVPLCLLALAACGNSAKPAAPASPNPSPSYFQNYLVQQGSITATEVAAAQTWTCAQFVQGSPRDEDGYLQRTLRNILGAQRSLEDAGNYRTHQS